MQKENKKQPRSGFVDTSHTSYETISAPIDKEVANR